MIMFKNSLILEHNITSRLVPLSFLFAVYLFKIELKD